MARLTVQDLVQKIQVAQHELEIPELDGSVVVRGLTVGQRDRCRKGVVDSQGGITDPAELELRIFTAGLAEPAVNREQANKLKELWPGEVWDRVIEAIGDLGVDPKEVERAAAQEFQGPDQ